jgi:hypothetical protein
MTELLIYRSEGLMSRFVRRVALLAVLAHMLLGCCLHHAHVEAAGGGEPMGAAGASHEHCGTCAHGVPHEKGRTDHPCNEPACVFVRPDDRSGPELAAPLVVAVWIEPFWAGAGPVGHAIDAAGLGSARCSPPVRPHLLKQVLLI